VWDAKQLQQRTAIITTAQNVCLSAGLQSLWTKFIFCLFAIQITWEILDISPGRTPTRTPWDRSTQSVCPLVTVSWEQPPWWKPPQTPKALKSKLCGPLFWCVKLFLSPCLLSAVCLLVFASLCFFGGTWCFTQGTRNAVYCVLARMQVTFLWPAPLLPCGRVGSVDSHWPFLMMSWLPQQPLADPCLCRITRSLRPCSQGCTDLSAEPPSSRFSSILSRFFFPAVLSASISAHFPLSPLLLLPITPLLPFSCFICFAFFNSLPHFSHSH